MRQVNKQAEMVIINQDKKIEVLLVLTKLHVPHSLRPPTSVLTPLRSGVEVPGSHSMRTSRSATSQKKLLGDHLICVGPRHQNFRVAVSHVMAESTYAGKYPPSVLRAMPHGKVGGESTRKRALDYRRV